MTKDYEAAIKKHNVASTAFRAAQDDYRARRIGDAEYLAARKAFNDASAEFDVAFAKEAA
jgi:hypothetical protein